MAINQTFNIYFDGFLGKIFLDLLLAQVLSIRGRKLVIQKKIFNRLPCPRVS